MRAAKALFIRHGAESTPEGRALLLLRQYLSPAQRRQFAQTGYFDVVGCDTSIRAQDHAQILAPSASQALFEEIGDDDDRAGGIRAGYVGLLEADISLSLFGLFALAQASGNLINRRLLRQLVLLAVLVINIQPLGNLLQYSQRPRRLPLGEEII